MSLGRPLIPDPLHYLRNFETALHELECRDADLLAAEEREFIGAFASLPEPTRALLVRLVMRKSALVRIEALRYPEIGELGPAVAPLLASGWIVAPRRLALEEFVDFFSKSELCAILKLPRVWLRRSKLSLLSALREHLGEDAIERCIPLLGRVWQLAVRPVCDTIRALYFGNFHQEWREFVLTALHVRRFEAVHASRPFQSAEQVQAFKALRRCHLLLDEAAAALEIEPSIPSGLSDCDWLEEARRDVIFKLARRYERQGDSGNALRLYSQCARDEARQRERTLRAASLPRPSRRHQPRFGSLPVVEIAVRGALPGRGIEYRVRDRLELDTPESVIYFVENSLICSLFGLLCWRAIFAPVRGAFFHRFHRGPADLHSPGFYTRRQALFEDCLAELDSTRYRRTIMDNFLGKRGVASTFVHWRSLEERLIHLSLECIPAQHLVVWFRYMLRDIKNNSAGFPDLIQLWPARGTYRLLEVKGARDRLQPNQQRCLEHLHALGLPVVICRPQATAREASATRGVLARC